MALQIGGLQAEGTYTVQVQGETVELHYESADYTERAAALVSGAPDDADDGELAQGEYVRQLASVCRRCTVGVDGIVTPDGEPMDWSDSVAEQFGVEMSDKRAREEVLSRLGATPGEQVMTLRGYLAEILQSDQIGDENLSD